ncbi:MAG: hypothetical protein CMF42_00485 [Legionellales bacterium]|nr:hypothetical protein [Legionellales bacterium]OUX68239.1 MAG: hypothetical protein CBD38_00030 [bacterium TMED178]
MPLLLMVHSAVADNWNYYVMAGFGRDHSELRYKQTFSEQPNYNWEGDYSLKGPGVDIGAGMTKAISPRWRINLETSAGISTAQSSLGLSSVTGDVGQVSISRIWMTSARVMPVYEHYGQIGGVLGIEAMDYKMDSNIASFGSVGTTNQIAVGFMAGITAQSAITDQWSWRFSWLETLFPAYDYTVYKNYSNPDDVGATANRQDVSFKPTIDRFLTSIIYYPNKSQDRSKVTERPLSFDYYLLLNPVKDVTELSESEDEEQLLKTFHLPLAVSGWGGSATLGKRIHINDRFFFGMEGYGQYTNSSEENQGFKVDYRNKEYLTHDWDVGLLFAPGFNVSNGQNIVVLAGIARGAFTEHGPEKLVSGEAIHDYVWGGVLGIRDEVTIDQNWRFTLGMKVTSYQTLVVDTGGDFSTNDLDQISSGIYSVGVLYGW